ncbi:hypothetical protein ACEPPN_018697 [Leptodophora sp. 'Broadleaf-Isolate-01']
MPITIYTHDQIHPATMNTGAPRTTISQTTATDPVPSVNCPVDGWPTLAKIIAEKPDLEAFASFTDLNIKSLLIYQAELIHLRKALHNAEYADFRSSEYEDSSSYAENLEALIGARDDSVESMGNSKPTDRIPMPLQWVIIEKMRITLEKYNAALLQYSQVAALREADRCNVRTLRGSVTWVGRERTSLTGDAAATWGDPSEITPGKKHLPELFRGLFTGSPDTERKVKDGEFKEHLIVPRQGKKPDGLENWVTRCFIPFYDRLRTEYLVPFCKTYLRPIWNVIVLLCHAVASIFYFISFLWKKLRQCSQPEVDPERDLKGSNASSNLPPVSPTISNITSSTEKTLTNNFTEYTGDWILRVTSLITTVVACLLPTVAITILAQVHHMGLILGLIALFTSMFAVGLVLLSSSSSRVEIFTATAA